MRFRKQHEVIEGEAKIVGPELGQSAAHAQPGQGEGRAFAGRKENSPAFRQSFDKPPQPVERGRIA